MLNKLAIYLIYLYQKTISPDKGLFSPRLRGKICSHTPHCSEYALQCFRRYPFGKALVYTGDRIMSCTPSHEKNIDPSSYRVVFCSGALIGVPFLQALHDDDRYDVVGVVCPPDQAIGRGMKTQQNIIKKTALKLEGIVNENFVSTPQSLRTTSKKYGAEAIVFKKWLASKDIDLLVVVAYGKIIPQEILDIPRVGPINVHGSLLPAYRGASPIQSVFLHEEKESGITVMLMSAGLDEGDMLAKLKTKLPLSRTAKDLVTRMQKYGPQHLCDTMREYGKDRIPVVAQDDSIATHCSKILKQDGLINPYVDTLQDIYRKYQAYSLRPKIHRMHGEKRVGIEGIQLDIDVYEAYKATPLLTKQSDQVTVNKSIQALYVKPEGKKKMQREDFVRGYLS